MIGIAAIKIDTKMIQKSPKNKAYPRNIESQSIGHRLPTIPMKCSSKWTYPIPITKVSVKPKISVHKKKLFIIFISMPPTT